jgi:hypothetical protein
MRITLLMNNLAPTAIILPVHDGSGYPPHLSVINRGRWQ